ncbi:MAG: DUF4199 domain-containing protein [Bacteroidota bacterium]|nr:DUF4199 domain-containing protein [Bacteroidota bacterium]
METQVNIPQVTTRSVGVRFGLIAALIGIVYFLVLNVAGIDMTRGIWNWVGYAITLTLVILAQKQFKEKGDGYMSYGQGIGVAFWMGLVSAVISSIFTYIYIKFIDTGFLQLVKDRQIEEMQLKGMSDEQIDQGMKMAAMFMTPEAMLIYMLLGGLIITVIIALIVTIFTQKKNPEPAF